jgi:hypothetical protein
MDIDKDPGSTGGPARPTRVPRVIAYVEPSGDASSFRRAVAAVEQNRKHVRTAVAIALVARLVFGFDLLTLLRDSDALLAQVPNIGLALLAYLLVFMWMAKNAGDRLGFGMALGLGVLEITFLTAATIGQDPFTLRRAAAPIVVALAHLPMVVFALRSASAYPPQDSKGPWVLGFLVALVLLAIPWVAPAVIAMMG